MVCTNVSIKSLLSYYGQGDQMYFDSDPECL